MAQSTRTGADVPASTLLAASSTPIQTGRRTRAALLGPVKGAFNVTIDTTPPTVAAISPTPVTTPGAAGGFSGDFTTAKATPIVLDITDATPGLSLVLVTDAHGATVFRTTSFAGDYVTASARANITGGMRLTILPSSGWPAGDDLYASSFITLKVDAVDLVGNLTSTTLVWTLPPSAFASAVLPTLPAVTGIDHVTGALSRLCEQFKDNS